MKKETIHKLDEVFSEFVRLRDSDKNGMVNCISCNQRSHWKMSDAGHFIPRANMSTRYHEQNVNGQCQICNRMDNGNENGYRVGLEKKYGEGVDLYLEDLKHKTVKISDSEGKDLIAHYRKEVKRIKKEKNI